MTLDILRHDAQRDKIKYGQEVRHDAWYCVSWRTMTQGMHILVLYCFEYNQLIFLSLIIPKASLGIPIG